MGNRAVITIEGDQNKKLGVYLHWNGGRASVEGFLKYCKLKGYRQPEEDNYGWARLCQVIGNFFGGCHSIGVDTVNNLDTTGDNGVYIIKDWEIIERQNYDRKEQMDYPLIEMLESINVKQPTAEQITDITALLEKSKSAENK